MELYLVRHTTPQIEKGICYGQTDIPVTNSFTEESDIIKLKLIDIIPNSKIYTSPLSRCLGLAKTLTDQPIIDNRLMELNFGDWEMKAWKEIEKRTLNKWMKDFVNVSCPNGESYLTLHKRTTQFIKEIEEKNLSHAIIITHGGVIRSILSYINETPLEKSFETEVAYGNIFKFQL